MIVIEQRPYVMNWSGNGNWYKLHSNAAKEDSTIRFGVRLMFKRYDQDAFVQLVELNLVPDNNGDALVNWQSVLHAELDYALPDISTPAAITRTGLQTGQFYIQYNELSSDNETGWINTESYSIRYVVKGGIPDFLFNNNAFWQNYFPDKKPFLTWQINRPLVALKERIYLAWLHPYNLNGTDFKLRVKIYYTDLSDNSKEIAFSSVPMNITYLPAGADMISLQQVDPAKKIWYWTCQVLNVTGPLAAEPAEVSELFTFEADNRPDYNDIILLFRNSPGGLDTVRIRGVIETALEYDLQEYTTVKQPPFNEGTVLSATRRFAPATELPTYKGDVGHLKKEQQDRLRELFLQRECYQVLSGKWVPYSIATKSLTLRKSTDKRWTLPIEFNLSTDGNAWYAPPSVDMGTGQLGVNACNCTIAIESYEEEFNDANTLAIITWNLSVNCPDGEPAPAKIQYLAEGYTDWTDVAWPAVGDIQTIHPAGIAQINVQWRVICQDGTPGDLTPASFDTLLPAPPAPVNSRLNNFTSGQLVVGINVNGTVVPGGIVAAGGYLNFYAPDGVGMTIWVTLDRRVTTVALESNGQTFLGLKALSSNTYAIPLVTIVNGCQINIAARS